MMFIYRFIQMHAFIRSFFWKLLWVVIVVICSLRMLGLGFNMFMWHMTTLVQRTVPSTSGKLVAVQYCPGEYWNDPEAGTIVGVRRRFLSMGNSSLEPLFCGYMTILKLEWVDDKKLNIYYREAQEVTIKRKHWRRVEINYFNKDKQDLNDL